MVEVPDYSFISKDTGPSLSGSIGNWLNIDKSVMDLRQQQANQAAGQAYQGAINPRTGEFDPNEFRRRLAAAGPAAMAAGAALANTQQISSDQLKQNFAKAQWINSTSGALLLQGDFSDAAMLGALHKGVAGGILTLPEAQKQLADMPPDAAGRKRWLEEHRDTAGSYAEQIQRQYGTRPQVSAGGSIEFPEVPAPGRGPAPSVVQTPTTGERYGLTGGYMPLDANGKQTTPDKAVTWQKIDIPRQGVGDMPPPGPAPIVTTPAPGSPPAAAPPGALPPGAPPPPPGTQLHGGRFGTAPATPAPNAATPSPAVAPRVAAPGVVSTPSGPAVITAPPQGQPEKLKSDVEAYTADQAAQPDVQTRAQNMAHAYDALQQLKSATGRGAEGINNLRSWMQTLGILPAGAVDEQRLFEIVHKYTERAMIDAAGGGSTDMGKRMQEQANAGTLLSTPANLEILRNDMGTTLQRMAAYKDHKDPSGVGYLQNRAKLADSTDPRGFVWNLYSPEEQAKINAEVDKDPVAAAKLHKAIGMAGRLKLQIPGLTPPPAPQRQSFLTPPQPEQNPLQMTG